MALAMRNYESAYGHLPPAVVYGENGQPLYSWRVLILPYIEEDELYRQFKLDEPWNSPHNIQLLERMPILYQCRREQAKQTAEVSHHLSCIRRVASGLRGKARTHVQRFRRRILKHAHDC